MAGTEYGGQCFCGNALVGSTELSDTSVTCPVRVTRTNLWRSVALTVYQKNGSSRRRRRHLSAHTNKHFAQPLKV